jgi:hypothetical protein
MYIVEEECEEYPEKDNILRLKKNSHVKFE